MSKPGNTVPSLAGRSFIKAGSSLMAFSTVSAVSSLNADSVWQGLQTLDTGKALVVYRQSEVQARQFASAFASVGITVQALGQDPVRQWRDGLGQQISEQGLMVTGMGNWADYTMIRGLAAEQRRLPLLELQHALGQNNPQWALVHAHELMQACACDRDSLRAALHALAARQTNSISVPSLFSWVLA